MQEVLEVALARRFQQHVPVMGAGRTDSGVHATGQAIHFDLPNADTDLGELTYVMNQMMPEVNIYCDQTVFCVGKPKDLKLIGNHDHSR